MLLLIIGLIIGFLAAARLGGTAIDAANARAAEANARADRAMAHVMDADARIAELEDKGALTLEKLTDAYEAHGLAGLLHAWRRHRREALNGR